MTSQVKLTQTFEDPISHERLVNPVILPCGHSFEKVQIDGWIASQVAGGRQPTCPLDRQPIAVNSIVPNRLIVDALAVLDNPSNSLVERVEDLTDEEREELLRAEASVRQRREADAARGIPQRLEPAQSFVDRAVTSVKAYYGC